MMRRHYDVPKTMPDGSTLWVRVGREEARAMQVVGKVQLSPTAKAKRDARKKQQKASRKANR